MACTSCNTPKFTSTAKELKDVIVQQLTRTIDKHCEGRVVQDIFPRTVIQAVYDACTGKYLDKILKEFNHILVPFKGDFKYTALSIPRNNRKKGLVITYTDREGNNKTYRYEGNNISNNFFSDINNWKEFFSEDTFFIPKNLRIENNRLKLDVLNKDDEAVDTLEVELPNTILPAITTQIVDRLPHTGDPSTIYLVPFGKDFNKFIWVSSLNKFEPLQGSTNFGGSCVSPSKSKDIYLTDVEIEDNILKFFMSNGLQYSVEIPNNNSEVDLTEVEDKISQLEEKLQALEGKEDKDTIFNPEAIESSLNSLKKKVEVLEAKEDKDTKYDDTSIKSRLDSLEARQDRDTIYDDSSLKSRISALESKRDNDTKYTAGANISISEDNVISASIVPFDPSEINNRLKALENKPTSSSYDDTAIKNRISALENRADSDTIYNDTEVKNRLSALEARGDRDTTYTAGENIRIENNVISAIVTAPDLSSFTQRLNDMQKQVDTLVSNVTKFNARITALEKKTDNDTIYDDTELRNLISAIQTEINSIKSNPPSPSTPPTSSEAKLLIQYIDESEQPKLDKSGYTELYDIPAEGGMHEMDTDNDYTTEVFLVPEGFIISRIDGPLGTQTPPSTSYDKVEGIILNDGKTYSGWRLHDNSGNGTHLRIYIKKV